MLSCLLAVLVAADSPVATRAEFEGGQVCSRAGWCWELPRPQGYMLLAFWGSSPKDVWAAGEAGTLIHYDGTSWSGIVGVVPGTLFALWGSGPKDIWAAGDGALLRFDGEAWRAAPPLVPGALRSLVGRNSDDVWAVGDKAAQHFDGRGWTPVPAPDQTGFAAVWFEGDRVLAQSGNGIFRFDKKSFVLAEEFSAGMTRPIAGPGHGRFALDRQRTLLERRGGAWVSAGIATLGPVERAVFSSASSGWVSTIRGAIRFDGKKWTRFAMPEPHVATIFWERTPDDVWAADQWGTPMHFDGRSWTAPRRPCGDFPAAPAASVAGDLWLVDRLDLCRRKPGGWELVPLHAGNSITAIGGTSPEDVWIATDAELFHWNGEFMVHLRDTPERLPSGADRLEPIRAFWARSRTDVWGVGEAGVALRWNGERWARVPSAANATLRAIWRGSTNDVWAVGDKGTAVHWNGKAFTSFKTPPMGKPGHHNLSETTTADIPTDARGNLTGVWGAATDDVWAVGGPEGTYGLVCGPGPGRGLDPENIEWGTALLHWDGKAWKAVATGEVIRLFGVWGRARDDVWALGDDVLMHFDGATWSKQALHGAQPMREGAIIGQGGDLFLIGDRSVRRVQSPVRMP